MPSINQVTAVLGDDVFGTEMHKRPKMTQNNQKTDNHN